MELASYPFCEKFGWLNDRFGLSWQLALDKSRPQKVTPFFMFTGVQNGKAEEAVKFYVSQFERAKINSIEKFGPGELGTEGTVKRAVFAIDGQEFIAMDSSAPHAFTFTPALSLVAHCDTQLEIDSLWKNLSDGGAEGHCGWLTDKFGVSWQIVPSILKDLMQGQDSKNPDQVMKALLKMSKLDIATLAAANSV